MSVRGIVYTICSVGLMALWYPAIKIALDRVEPLQAAAIETLISVLCGTSVMLVNKKVFKNPHMKALILIGVLNAFATVCLYVSLDLLDPVMSSLLGRNYTIFCLILSIFILRERISGAQWLLIGLSIIGGFLFVYKDTGVPSLLGVVLVTTYTILYAVANLLTKKYCYKVDSTTTVFYIKTVSLLPIFLFGLSRQGTAFVQVSLQDLVYISCVSLITMYLGLTLFYKAISISSFAHVNTIRSMSPLFVFLYSLPFFPPQLTVSNSIGGITTLVSVALLSVLDFNQQRKQNNLVPSNQSNKTA